VQQVFESASIRSIRTFSPKKNDRIAYRNGEREKKWNQKQQKEEWRRRAADLATENILQKRHHDFQN
jgi:hypothetical protein